MAEFYELMIHLKPEGKFADREEHTFGRIHFKGEQLEDIHKLMEYLTREWNFLLPEVLMMTRMEHRRSQK